jgi:HD-GYP domain-containing protein (c-di-GMP phosphodiesterase class II)
MKIGTTGLVFALSDALDAVEKEFIGAEPSHARRVAYISTQMGKKYGYDDEKLEDLAVCAVMHDSALTNVYEKEEKDGENNSLLYKDVGGSGSHCIDGQKNIEQFPFLTDIYKDVILYHHEEANGKGPFHKKEGEVPFAAEILHLADSMDNWTRAYGANRFTWEKVSSYLNDKRGVVYAKKAVDLFFETFTKDKWDEILGTDIKILLKRELKPKKFELSEEEFENICHVFGNIVDNKSHFTRTHSKGIGEKAQIMGRFYKYDSLTCAHLLCAGYLHDIGKMMIPNSILEKPGQLTNPEYDIMKLHVTYSYQMLTQISGIEDITTWACSHHEKLDGTGYPFKKDASNLSKNERLLGVIDIYQALREDRPYRKGMTHQAAMKIIYSMANSGKIDLAISHDVDTVFANT